MVRALWCMYSRFLLDRSGTFNTYFWSSRQILRMEALHSRLDVITFCR
jgi:hypothetical protein